VTPLYAQDQWGNIDWMQYLCLWEHLSADMKRVAELVGIQERYLARAVRSGGTAPRQTAAQARTAAIHRRFYAAMALHDLATEMPLPEVVKKYGCTRGVLQSLQQSAATFAGTRFSFCC
jgi:DNA polymerase theta